MHEHKTESAGIMNSEIIKSGDATMQVSRLGVKFNGEVSLSQVESLLTEAGSVTRGCMFILGDAINYAEGRWGDKYDRWLEITGLEYQTLRNAAWVARSVDLSLRRDNLTFDHHKLVASLDAAEQERWLNLTDREGMSVRRMRKSLLLGRPVTDEEMETCADGGIENVHPYVNRLCAFWGKLKRKGWVASAGAEKLRGLKSDLQPVVDIYNELPD